MKKHIILLLLLTFIPISGFAVTAESYYHDGLTAYQVGKWGEAITYFEGAIQVDPNNWQAFQMLGYAYYRISDTQKRIQNCEASLRLNPNNPTLQTFVDKIKTQNIPAPGVFKRKPIPMKGN